MNEDILREPGEEPGSWPNPYAAVDALVGAKKAEKDARAAVDARSLRRAAEETKKRRAKVVAQMIGRVVGCGNAIVDDGAAWDDEVLGRMALDLAELAGAPFDRKVGDRTQKLKDHAAGLIDLREPGWTPGSVSMRVPPFHPRDPDSLTHPASSQEQRDEHFERMRAALAPVATLDKRGAGPDARSFIRAGGDGFAYTVGADWITGSGLYTCAKASTLEEALVGLLMHAKDALLDLRARHSQHLEDWDYEQKSKPKTLEGDSL